MTLDLCRACKYNRCYENGAVHCGYDLNIVCIAAVFNPKEKKYVILTCPKKVTLEKTSSVFTRKFQYFR